MGLSAVRNAWERLGSWSLGRTALAGLAGALLVEGLTCFLRFGLGMRGTRDTAWVGPLTFGVRIHHAYVGAVVLCVAALMRRRAWRNLLIVVGVAMVVSDLIHHFAVLLPLTGSADFDLRYPR